MVVHGKGDATAQMADYQVLFLIFHTMLAAVAFGYLALVERMPYRLMGNLGHS